MSAQNQPKLSILLPTRGRTTMLDNSISSLIDLADDPGDIEWFLAFDHDDTDNYGYFSQNIANKITDSGATYYAIEYQRMGYGRLNEYVNDLAKRSQGDWMIFWNDDAVMKSQGWDTVIKSHTGKFVLQAFDTHNKHPYSIFPIVPRQWLNIIGHLSLHPLNDAWLSQIAWLLDIMLPIDVQVDHERFDLTGRNQDQTFNDRVIFEGRPEDPRDFNHINFRRLRLGEAGKIANYLVKHHDYDITRWNNILSGKTDPWEKMLAADVNKQMTREK